MVERCLCNYAYVFIRVETQEFNVFFLMCDSIDPRTSRTTCAVWPEGMNLWENKQIGNQ